MNFSKVNNLVGWITGLIATTVYILTMEPTVSFWDCGEFISCAYKIEVGHSPGAPLFMMIQRLFGLLAGSDTHKVAMMMNAWSAIASGLTILFLFWTITHFARRIVIGREGEPGNNQMIMIMGAGVIGALAYTFSDTFWFSAVEAEVYATSSFFTALVFWAILKWEHVADQPGADKWLVFIAYMMGLSVGIHLLNLLAIPAIAMVYYFRKYEVTTFGTVIAFLVGCALLGLIQFGVLQGLPILASKLDLLFVNSFGMPFDSGAFVFIALLIAVLAWGVIFVKRKGWYLAHTGMLCLIFIIIGFTSYLAPLIRSRADTPIDMTNPDNAISLVSYIQREQFGSQPLLFGPDFDKRPINYDVTGQRYIRSKKDGKDFYETVGNKIEPVFDNADKRFFPRIWDYNDPGHINFYRQYLGLAQNEAPSSSDNFNYFFNYQINWMWWRYFMWNYAGRQNDIEGQGDPKNGNWISGITAIDNGLFGKGDIDARTATGYNDGYKNTPSRNELYMLPFALGIIGLIFQFNKNKRDGYTVLVLFFFTGIATAIYLNMSPLQPRERDYAFAGSTYAFAIWIGLGVLMVNEWFQKFLKGNAGSALAVILCLVAVPALMAKEEWDDHDRSKKTLAHSTATNVLSSCEKNAILFTFGDNDTYPLWYLQEVEGYRTDVRIINMSLLGIDWYIEQLTNRINDAMPVPMVWQKKDYVGDRRNYMRYVKSPQIPSDRYFNLNEICNFIISDNPDAKVQMSDGSRENFLPSKNFFLPALSKDELVAKHLVSPADTNYISTDVRFTFPKDIAYKDDLAAINIIAAIAAEGWERPVYFSGGLPGDNYIGMDDYMKLEGVVFRLMPYKQVNKSPSLMGEMGSVNLDKCYDLFANQYTWGNADRNDVYFDEKNRLMFAAYRINSSRVAMELYANGKAKEAKEVLDKVKKGISESAYQYDATAYYMAIGYYNIGDKETGREMALKLAKNAADELNYYETLSEDRRAGTMQSDVRREMQIVGSLSQTAGQTGDTVTAKELEAQLQMMAAKVR
ncbi:MAG: DUF2723 domain-containing protein [Chitinophagales bacterium]|nr:DUF2723 domain-containing protein [Chitinophagales bacterium]